MEQPTTTCSCWARSAWFAPSLLHQAMQQPAAPQRPRTCATCTTSMPRARPCALRLPAGQGLCCARAWRSSRARCKPDIPKRLDGADWRAESERIEKPTRVPGSRRRFAALDAFAEALQFRLSRERAHGLHADQGQPDEADARALTRERRTEIDAAEQNCVPDRPLPRHHRPWNASATRRWNNCAARSPNRCSTSWNCESAQQPAQTIRTPSSWASGWTRYTSRCWNLVFFILVRRRRQRRRAQDELRALLAPLPTWPWTTTAPTSARAHRGQPAAAQLLFGSIEYQAGADACWPTSCIHAGSLLQGASGLSCQTRTCDLLGNEGLWERSAPLSALQPPADRGVGTSTAP